MKLPTIHGDILVSLNQDAGLSFNLDTSIPANTTAEIYLPKVGDNYMLTVDGKIVKDAKADGAWVIVNSPSGSHSFRIKKN